MARAWWVLCLTAVVVTIYVAAFVPWRIVRVFSRGHESLYPPAAQIVRGGWARPPTMPSDGRFDIQVETGLALTELAGLVAASTLVVISIGYLFVEPPAEAPLGSKAL